jgi:hypothetical protein
MARRGYPPEFRGHVVDLVEGGRKVSQAAADLLDSLSRDRSRGLLPAEARPS